MAKILVSGKGKMQNYVDALTGVGAQVTAKYLPEVDLRYDGLVLCGGGDIDPKYYHEENTACNYIDPARDTAEFALIKAYAEAGKPVLGICRGYQLINVFFGGSLHQHIPQAPLHTDEDRDLAHLVTARADSFLADLYGTTFCVNSSHHQAVKELGKGLEAMATWQEQYIEAFKHTTLPIIGVQWHPERMCFGHKRPDTVDGAGIFAHFVNLCEKK